MNRESRERARERRCLHQKSPDGTDTSSVMWSGGQISPPPPPKPTPTRWNLLHNTTQQYGPHTKVWALDSHHLPLHKITYWPMILMALCIIDFIEAYALLGPVGGRGPWTLLGPNGTRFAWYHLRTPEVSWAPSPPLAQVMHSPLWNLLCTGP